MSSSRPAPLNAFFRQRRRSIDAEGRAASKVAAAVRSVIRSVRRDGDSAVRKYTAKWDKVKVKTIRVSDREWSAADRALKPADRQVLEFTANRLRRFYTAQKQSAVPFVDETGFYSERISPLDRVGLYVPGGRAPLISTALMLAIPAAVAGVRERYIATPPQADGAAPPLILSAARLAGVTAVFKMGGAQALAAFAYGTKTVPKVDKIFGPGNRFVTAAKKILFGDVGVDMLAGPSELAVIADDSADPAMVAADLLAQAEHGPDSLSILLTPDRGVAKAVRGLVAPEKKLATQIFVAELKSLVECVSAATEMAPEHLSLCVREPEKLLPTVGPAGAIFLGSTAVAHGDYIAGPNHTLPTAGAARFSSALSIESFFRRSSVLNVRDPDGELSRIGERMARMEGLDHHANSLRLRAARSARRS